MKCLQYLPRDDISLMVHFAFFQFLTFLLSYYAIFQPVRMIQIVMPSQFLFHQRNSFMLILSRNANKLRHVFSTSLAKKLKKKQVCSSYHFQNIFSSKHNGLSTYHTVFVIVLDIKVVQLFFFISQ